jgi:tape measure domain-containing protein
MSDFQISVGGDFRDLLQGFQQLEARAQQAGQNVGKGIGEGIQGFSSKSLAALNQELNRLQQRQLKVAVDSSAFQKAGVRIKEVQGLISTVQRQQLLIQVDDRSVTALQTKLTDLQNRQTEVSVDSQEFVELQRQINATEKELQQISQRKVLIDANANSFLAVTARLRNELNGLQERQLKIDVDSQEFVALGREIDRVEGELTALERKRTAVTIDSSSVQALQTRLQDLQTRQTKVSVDSRDFIELQKQIDATEKELEQINQKKILIDADGNSFLAVTTRLKNELDTLQQKQIKVDVDSQEFIALGREIDRVEGELTALDRKRTAVTIDASSVQALQTKLNDLQARQTKVSVDSKEFADLQVQIDKVQDELAQVERKKILINVDGNSITALTTKLKAELTALEQRQLKVNVDSQEFKTLSQQIDRVEGELTALDRRKLLITADPSSIIALRSRLGELQGQLEKTQIGSQRFRELQREIQKTEAEVARATQSTRTLSSILNADIGGGIFGQLAGLASAGAVASFFKSSIDEAVKLETITRKLSNTLGDQGAAGALSFTRKLSDELGLSFNTLASTFGSFTAAASSANVPMQQQQELFAAVSRSAQQLGLTNDELSGSLLALQQVASKGTVQMEELRGQLGERLPIAFGATARGLGLTQQELIKLVESGGLQADRFFAGLTKGLNELNSSNGGLPTAAQNFQKLGNAWTDLQASFGTSLLPGLTKTVEALSKALEGVKVEGVAKDLRQSFGLTANEATQMVGALRQVQEQYSLSAQQAKNLLSTAIANTGASRNWFGELNLGGKQFAQVQVGLIDLAKKWREANPDLAAQGRQEAIELQKVLAAQKEALNLENVRKASAVELAKVYGQAQVERLRGQAELGTQLVGLARSLADVEQSRFEVVKSGLQFELQALEQRGASEQVLAAKKAEIAAADQAALSARYRALTQQQALEEVVLQLSQERARTEANLEILEQRASIKRAEAELAKATTAEEKAAAEAQIALQQEILGVTVQKAALLAQTQPIEQAIAAATAEVARNGLQSQAAAEGFRINADGSLTAVRGVASALQGVSVTSKLSADGQERFKRVAEQSGLAIDRAADGSVVLGRNQAEVARAVAALNTELNKGKAAVDATARGTGGIGQGISNAANPAKALEGSFTATGRAAPAIVQGSRDFAAFLSGAKGSGQAIERLSLDSKFRSVASSMGTAANSAKSFYDWLRQAAALPGARWTGGPVDAGAEYRVNELGQEAFLSAGRLSLIDKPQNAIWRAPSSGVVIPAGVTSRLQEAGALQGQVSAQPAGVAGLAIEVGKLREEVGNLARRDWNIHVQQRTGPTASQVMNQIHRLR